MACSAAARPNVVFLYTDDQAAWTIGALGNADARTPHLDRLVREGAVLENSFAVTPVCSPSRAGLLTSRYGTELGITDYLTPEEGLRQGAPSGLTTWPEILRAGGYRTALIGKWHLGARDEDHPTQNGYEYFFGFRHGGMESKDTLFEEEGEEKRLAGFTTEILTDRALRLIRDWRNETFLLSVHYWAPHANQHKRREDGDRTWLPLPDRDWDPFIGLQPRLPEYPGLDVPRARRMMTEYLASIAGVDRNVGRILDLLDELDLADETLVVFTSDHGYNMGHHGIWHKGNGRWILTTMQGSRPNLWDTSLRVPSLVRWPGAVAPGSRIARTATNLDWYPTLVEAAGLRIPAGAVVRGRSLVPLLKGEKVDWDDSLYAQYDLHHGDTAGLRTWRTPEWKLIRDFVDPSRNALYRLGADPEERTNLYDAAEAAEARRALTEALAAYMRTMGDPRSAGAETAAP